MSPSPLRKNSENGGGQPPLCLFIPILCCDDTFAEVDTLVKKEMISLLEKRTQLFYTSVLKDDFSLFTNPLVYEMKQGVLEHG